MSPCNLFFVIDIICTLSRILCEWALHGERKGIGREQMRRKKKTCMASELSAAQDQNLNL
jgi:hypothetical protein